MKNRIREYRYPIYGFIIVFCIWIFVFISLGIIPFGSDLYMSNDFSAQYMPMLLDFKDFLQGKSNLFLSWENCSGSDFFTNFTYYLTSPLNLLLIFIPKSFIPVFLVYLSVIRNSLMAFTAGLFIKKILNINNWSTTFFCIIYSLCAFTTVNICNIIWLDSFILYPLLLIGLFELINHQKTKMYSIVLFLTIFCNFYLAIIICLSLVVIFCCQNNWSDKEASKINIKNFLKSSIISGCLNAVILIPAGFALTSNLVEKPLISLFSFIDSYFNTFQNLFFGATPIYSTTNYEYAALYCGVGLLFLFPHFFMMDGVKLSLKLKVGITEFLMIFATNFGMLNFIFHGFHLPVGIPNRFLFINAILLISVGIYVLNNRDKIDKQVRLISSLISMVILITIMSLSPLDIIFKVINVLLLIMYVLLFNFSKVTAFSLLLAVEVSVQGFMILMGPLVLPESIVRDFTDISSNIKVEEYQQTAFDDYMITNVGYLANAKSFNGFSSMVNPSKENVPKLGMGNEKNRVQPDGLAPFQYALFGIKYVESVYSFPEFDNFKEVTRIKNGIDESDIILSENTDDVSMVHMFDEDILDINLTYDVFNNINNIYSVLEKTDKKIFTPVDVEYTFLERYMEQYSHDTAETISQNFSLPGKGSYAFYPSVRPSSVFFVIKEDGYGYENYKHFDCFNQNMSFYDLTYNKPITAEILYSLNNRPLGKLNTEKKKENPLIFAKYDKKELDNLTKSINSHGVKNMETSQNKVTINTSGKGILTVSTFFSKGWDVYVDGKKSEVIQVLDTLTGVAVPEGEHTVVFKYTTPGFYLGLTVTVVLSMFLLKPYIFRVINQKILEKKKK